MDPPPLRRRPRLWAWIYLVLFGGSENDGDDEGDDGAVEPTGADRDDVLDSERDAAPSSEE